MDILNASPGGAAAARKARPGRAPRGTTRIEGDTREWVEHGQRFRFEGCVIRSLKPAKLKMAYGDERLRELAAERADANRPRSGLRGLLGRLLPGPTPTDN